MLSRVITAEIPRRCNWSTKIALITPKTPVRPPQTHFLRNPGSCHSHIVLACQTIFAKAVIMCTLFTRQLSSFLLHSAKLSCPSFIFFLYQRPIYCRHNTPQAILSYVPVKMSHPCQIYIIYVRCRFIRELATNYLERSDFSSNFLPNQRGSVNIL